MRTVAFPTLQGRWTPITAVKKLNARKPLALILDGIPVVAFRDETGRARALVDRCPHRSSKLSTLTQTPTGATRCVPSGASGRHAKPLFFSLAGRPQD